MSAIANKFIDAAGIRTHYLEAGDGGSPAILIHGGGPGADATTNWTGCLPVLAREHRVFAPDMVGFGTTAKPDSARYSYSQGERIDWLASFVQALGLGPVTLVGNSMGGAAALGVATRHSQLVSKLILMGSAGLRLTEPPSPELKAIQDYDFTFEGMLRMIKGLTAKGYEPAEAVVRYRLESSLRPDNRDAYGRIMAWNRQHSLNFDEDEVRSVQAPTLVIAGKEDKVVPLSNAFRFLQLIPQSWGCIIPGCGHWVMIERPTEFCEIVLRFLAGKA